MWRQSWKGGRNGPLARSSGRRSHEQRFDRLQSAPIALLLSDRFQEQTVAEKSQRENWRIFTSAKRCNLNSFFYPAANLTMLAATFEFVTSDTHDPETRAMIGAPLREFNLRAVGPNHFTPLCIAIKDEHGNIVGGLWGHTAWGWLYTELLVVPEASRGAGLGTQLMSIAEAEAVQRGCHSAWLDTHEFQARGFYEKLGYTEFGRLENFPTGYARHYFQKQLLTTT